MSAGQGATRKILYAQRARAPVKGSYIYSSDSSETYPDLTTLNIFF